MNTLIDQQEPGSESFLKALGSRIAIMADLVGSKKKLADAAGISESQLYRCIKGSSATTIEPLVAMAQAAGVSIKWVVHGTEPMRTDCTSEQTPPAHNLVNISLANSSEQPSMLALANNWITERGWDESHLQLVSARGDSMSPTIRQNSLVLVDSREIKLEDGHIFAFHYPDNPLIRRVQLIPGQGYWLLADNKRYNDTLVKNDDIMDLTVIGRVVWIAQEV
jgi:DNA-binding phage protein